MSREIGHINRIDKNKCQSIECDFDILGFDFVWFLDFPKIGLLCAL